jgi:hypothetical protein
MALCSPGGIVATGTALKMMLRLNCPCGHTGVVGAHLLPRELTCSCCGSSQRVEVRDCARIVSTEARQEWVRNIAAAR